MQHDVRGRGSLVAVSTPNADGATVRLDDARRPEWWAEVRLSLPALRELVRLCEAEAAEQSRAVTA